MIKFHYLRGRILEQVLDYDNDKYQPSLYPLVNRVAGNKFTDDGELFELFRISNIDSDVYNSLLRKIRKIL